MPPDQGAELDGGVRHSLKGSRRSPPGPAPRCARPRGRLCQAPDLPYDGHAMRCVSVGISDVGRRRTINEDAFHRDDQVGFYVVADGVGGHSKGEIASSEAVEQLTMWVARETGALDRLGEAAGRGDSEARWEIRRLLENGVQSACYMVFGMAELDPDK